jgi:hypothetical protein
LSRSAPKHGVVNVEKCLDFPIFPTSSAQGQINNEAQPLGTVLRPHFCLSLGREGIVMSGWRPFGNVIVDDV